MSMSWDEAASEPPVVETSASHASAWDLDLTIDGEGGAEAMLDRLLDWPTA